MVGIIYKSQNPESKEDKFDFSLDFTQKSHTIRLCSRILLGHSCFLQASEIKRTIDDFILSTQRVAL